MKRGGDARGGYGGAGDARRAGSPHRRWKGRQRGGEAPGSGAGGTGRGHDSDRGSATVWSLGAIAVLCVVFGAVLALGQAVVVRHRAAGGADLAALAAADHWAEGGAAACARAERLAAAQEVRLVRCVIVGDTSEVTAAAGRGPFTAEVRARAGPPGVAGLAGAPGLAGAQGPTGTPGPAGAASTAGSAGAAGTPSPGVPGGARAAPPALPGARDTPAPRGAEQPGR